jgi:hypothetical protein
MGFPNYAPKFVYEHVNEHLDSFTKLYYSDFITMPVF